MLYRAQVPTLRGCSPGLMESNKWCSIFRSVCLIDPNPISVTLIMQWFKCTLLGHIVSIEIFIGQKNTKRLIHECRITLTRDKDIPIVPGYTSWRSKDICLGLQLFCHRGTMWWLHSYKTQTLLRTRAITDTISSQNKRSGIGHVCLGKRWE